MNKIRELTNEKLKLLLGEFDLTISGNKSLLLERIETHILKKCNTRENLNLLKVSALRHLTKVLDDSANASKMNKSQLIDLIISHSAPKSEPSNDNLTYASLTVSELKDKLRMRSLSTSGLKSDLIQRLVRNDDPQITKYMTSDSSTVKVPDVNSSQNCMSQNRTYDDLTTVELKNKLKVKGLKVTGNKSELIQKLTESQNPDLEPKFDELTVADIKNKLKEKGLKTTGNKAELIQRLNGSQQDDIRSDFDNLSVPELREKLKRKGLKSTGKKAELIQRLVEGNNAGRELARAYYDELSTSELRKLLYDEGLNDNGKKKDLIERLVDLDMKVENRENFLVDEVPMCHLRIMLLDEKLSTNGTKEEVFNRISARILTQEDEKRSTNELKTELEKLNLDTSGNKQDIIYRSLPADLQTTAPNLDLRSKSIPELKEILKTLGAPTTGSRGILISNIQKAMDRPHDFKGYIYIVESPSYNNRVKIGETKDRSTLEAVKNNLYNRYRTALGSTIKFTLFSTNKRKRDEETIHNLLVDYRELKSELFSCPLTLAIKVCQSVTGSVSLN